MSLWTNIYRVGPQSLPRLRRGCARMWQARSARRWRRGSATRSLRRSAPSKRRRSVISVVLFIVYYSYCSLLCFVDCQKLKIEAWNLRCARKSTWRNARRWKRRSAALWRGTSVRTSWRRSASRSVVLQCASRWALSHIFASASRWFIFHIYLYFFYEPCTFTSAKRRFASKWLFSHICICKQVGFIYNVQTGRFFLTLFFLASLNIFTSAKRWVAMFYPSLKFPIILEEVCIVQ